MSIKDNMFALPVAFHNPEYRKYFRMNDDTGVYEIVGNPPEEFLCAFEEYLKLMKSRQS